jgi:hypothetical protein
MKAKKVFEYLDLTPKSKEDLDKSLDSLTSPQHQFNMAVKYNLLDKVKELLKNPEVDPNYMGGLAINHAITEGHYKMVDLLLQDKRVREYAGPGQWIRPVLIYNAQQYRDILELLKKYGINEG